MHHWLQVLILLSYTVINDTIQNSFLNLAPQQKLIALIGFSDIFDTVNGANYLSFTAVDFLKIPIMVSRFFLVYFFSQNLFILLSYKRLS